MKEKRFKRRAALVAAVLGTSLSLTGFSCVRPIPFNPSNEIPEDVYGPPVFEESEEPEENFDPSEEVPQPVYGPPSMMG